MSLEQLRRELDARGLGPELAGLPGDAAGTQPVEGALRVIETPTGYDLVCVDYGGARVISSAPDAESIEAALRGFLDRQLPATLPVAASEIELVERNVGQYYPPLRQRLGSGGAELVQLPPGIPVDRIGAMDGWLLYPLNASFESRSLPPTALREPSAVHQFITESTVLVQASIVRPWFGQPGGSVRFTIADESVTIRDLLVEGSLRRIATTVGAAAR